MRNFINTELLPLDVSDSAWLFEYGNNCIKYVDTGKWMLYYDNSIMNEAWLFAKKLYRENKLDGIMRMKCSTLYENPRASKLDEGIIILYCSNSSNEETIMNIGKNMLEMFDYKEQQYIYYKTDKQTQEGTMATGSRKNHTYTLFNHLYKGKCLIKLQTEEEEAPLRIKRYYPTKKQEQSYPKRYKDWEFKRFREMNTDTNFQNDYKKWKDGINYKTNRKINIGGKVHDKLKEKFMITTITYINSCSQSHSSFLFEDLIDINADEYLQETDKINNNIDNENDVIQAYNKLVDSLIEKIENLKNWYEYQEFEEEKYGLIHNIKNNIHVEDNCFGKMIFTYSKTETSFNCRSFGNYNDTETTYLTYTCHKCNYEHKIIEHTGGESTYVSNYDLCIGR
jgi:hypothetical protein